ncbi:MAG: hypothetical protein RLZ47_31 [Bacteroidota bacterium]|jgi:putative endonuclease
MKKYVFIITDRNRNNLHVGLSTDLMKTMDFYSAMPCLFFDPGQQLSRLVYFEEYDNEQMANSRFRLINQFTKMQKERLVRSVNLDWIDLTPALHKEAALHLQADLFNLARVA